MPIQPPRLAELAPDHASLQRYIKDSHKQIEDQIVNGSCPQQDLDIRYAYKNSLYLLKEYATLDWHHCSDILELVKSIAEYAKDSKRKRPLNVVMHADPGSGKSHFVECLAQSMSRNGVSLVTANMTSTKDIHDLLEPLEAIRNLKVRDKLPILFLDEFDSDSDDKRYSLLLPLLWDGALSAGGRTLRTGKIVIILAGSRPEIGLAITSARSMKRKLKAKGKLIDLVSRINGPELTISSLENRKVDKICLAIALLRVRFGPDLIKAPWALLKFISQTKFRHGVRSIGNLIDLIEIVELNNGALDLQDLELPLRTADELTASHLPIHLIEDGGSEALTRRWNGLVQCPRLVKFADRDIFWTRLLNWSVEEIYRQKKP